MWNYTPPHKNPNMFDNMTVGQLVRIAIEGAVLGLVIVTALVLWL